MCEREREKIEKIFMGKCRTEVNNVLLLSTSSDNNYGFIFLIFKMSKKSCGKWLVDKSTTSYAMLDFESDMENL